MDNIKVVIIDDETRVRSFIKNALLRNYPTAEVVGEGHDVKSGIKAIEKCKPDVVLLDIKMPDGTAFDLLKQIMPVDFRIIFITAHDEFAIQAIKCSALDYLLKPIMPVELITALQKAEKELNSENLKTQLSVFMDNFNTLKKENKKIVLNSSETIQVIPINEIVSCEARGNYTNFMLRDKAVIFVTGNLKKFEEQLTPFGFYRSHESHLVNLSLVVRLEKRNGGSLIMEDKSEVPISDRKYKGLVIALSMI